MLYLILQMLFCLIIAAILGFILGWLMKGCMSCKQIGNLSDERDRLLEKTFDVEASASSKAVGDASEMHGGSYDITEIEGIGKGYGQKLNNIGINTTQDLLIKGQSSAGSAEIAGAVGNIEDSVVQKWLSMADLVNVPGVRGQFAELLEASGIDSAATLARQDASKLAAHMADVNSRENRTRTNPTLEMTTVWIENANKLT